MNSSNDKFFKHKCLLLCISKALQEGKELYEATRFAWKLDVNNARRSDYILGIERSIIRGVFIAEQWYPCTAENLELFPRVEQPGAQFTYERFLFTGREAENEVKRYYIGKRVPHEYRFYGAAVLYTY